MRKIIELKNITKIYRSGEEYIYALKDINLEAKEGEFICFMGPSGSGKTTLLNIIGLMDKPTSGEYFLEGKKVDYEDENLMAELRNKYFGFIFQQFYLIPNLNVFENIELPLILANVEKKKRKEIVNRLVKMVGLEKRINHYPYQLSGGQQQRVAIARALANNPKVILADEPTGNLDLKSAKIVMEILTKLNEELNKTIILVTHDPNIAKYAQKIFLISYGKIVMESDNINEIIRQLEELNR